MQKKRGSVILDTINDTFIVHRAKSALFDWHDSGDTPFVSHGSNFGGVIGYVQPMPQDAVFQFCGVTISSFCEASVHAPPFIGDGRSGNGLVILEPKNELNLKQLAYVASYINIALRWRFSWYRQTTADRIRRLPFNFTDIPEAEFPVAESLPPYTMKQHQEVRLEFEPFTLESLFEIVPGEYHSVSRLDPGQVPVISCGDENNGIIGFFDIDPSNIHSPGMTIAFNGLPLTTKRHPYLFGAKDDVAVCKPKKTLRPTTQFFIQLMLNRERWRYSFYRKCYHEKLSRFKVLLPVKNSEIDEDSIQAIVENIPYWSVINH
jgi:hypothetical protein